MTATVTEARYVRSGCIVQAWGVLAVTGSGTSGNAVTVSLPVTASGHSANAAIGNGVILESSANDQTLVVVRLDTTSTVSFMSTETTQGRWGVFPSKGLATGDSVQFNVRYTV